MIKQLKIFVQAIAAGVMIAIGGTVYMICESKLLGAFLFAVGLYMVCMWKFNLFTGKVGYVVEDKKMWCSLAQIWLGNLCGVAAVGYAMRATRMYAKMSASVTAAVEGKINDSLFSAFILGIFCGMLMFLAVDTFKNTDSGALKAVAVILPIAVFIIAGFNHCIADMFYISAANMWSLKALVYILVVTVGNTVGSVIIGLFKKFR